MGGARLGLQNRGVLRVISGAWPVYIYHHKQAAGIALVGKETHLPSGGGAFACIIFVFHVEGFATEIGAMS